MLNKEKIKTLVDKNNLIENYINLDKQLTPNGFDLTLADIFEFKTPGALDFSNKERVVPEGKKLMPEKKNQQDKFGWWNLKKGTYRVRTNETVNMPNDLTALAFSRTSLMRMGAYTVHGVWDAGFCGRSEFILTVQNPEGISLKQNARIAQLVFFVTDETEGYNGIYQEK
ncbi:MAG TPA: deoxyuridine 5'-triphosphate nucleotidohydrolase [Candidatus Omnitrophica bacterium]|nr:deoxyuridine 5'-triphosphate nucleotidohydrolase [Candidatus Omnitrophota bacterium]